MEVNIHIDTLTFVLYEFFLIFIYRVIVFIFNGDVVLVLRLPLQVPLFSLSFIVFPCCP